MNEAIELLRRIESKLEEIEKRLRRLEEELIGDEITEDEFKEIEEIARACETGEMKVYTLKEAKKELGLE
ncbi:MAG: hypothetical protein ABWW66_00420 [Archaeoglobaceae archaeon]